MNDRFTETLNSMYILLSIWIGKKNSRFGSMGIVYVRGPGHVVSEAVERFLMFLVVMFSLRFSNFVESSGVFGLTVLPLN